MLNLSAPQALVDRVTGAAALGRAPLVAERVRADLADLLARGALELPEASCRPSTERYARRLLYRDPQLRFTVLVMTWGPGQGTPIHDHAGLWCVECVVDGEIEAEVFRQVEELEGGRVRLVSGGAAREGAGMTGAFVSPLEVHRMCNPSSTRKAVTLHVYGGELEECSVFLPLGDGVYQREARSLSYSPDLEPTPVKAAGFRIHQKRPFNAGPQLARLGESPITPVEQFFVRNHGDVPALDPTHHRLFISGEVSKPVTLSLSELVERFPHHTITATLQCAGNRREEMAAFRPIPHELGWGAEAIGNATWTGVALADVLAVAAPTARAAHVELIGADETERGGQRFRFGGSIPLAKALDSECLLAFEMNGRPLPPLHGAPLRAIVPGWIGARSVKWLEQIRLLRSPSENYFQARAYRLFKPDVNAENVAWEEGKMLGELSVSSIITSPASGAEIPAGLVKVAGVALGSGRSIERVEVSSDGGQSWQPAPLGEPLGRWGWRLWACELELPPGEHEIIARAWDSAAQSQPENVEQIWNFKGYMNNAWPRITFRCW